MAPTKLAIYDFDDTLFRSPVKPMGWEGVWWGDLASLTPPLVPAVPGPEWWNGSVVERARLDIANPNTVTVMITGRLARKFPDRVRQLLGQVGLRFDKLFFSPGGDTHAFKLEVIRDLLNEYLSVRGVDIWEDRGENLQQYADFVEIKGRAAFPHLITVPAHPLEAPSPVKVASRRLAGVKSVGLFLPLPKALAGQFPSLGEKDDSPTHATLLIVGDIDPDREDYLLGVVKDQLSRWPSPITATLKGTNYFDNADAVVAYDRVRFDTDMARLRSDLASTLFDKGFYIEDRSPVSYSPHVTLAYMRPGSFGEYQGPVPEGSWSFDEVEMWCRDGDPVRIPLGGSAVRVAAKYKSKKKIKTQDGDEATVYEYSDRQIANRHREKAERVEHLRKNISDLRARVQDDLKDEDPQTSMTALAVALMDETCERVGNDESAEEGHFGVTGWKVKHVTFKGDTATFKYVGKSGVKHEKVVDHGPTVKALKELTKGRGDEDCIFETDDATVSSDDVNDYLAEFDITAKDIRGFRANDEMLKALKKERAGGPRELPTSRKEKDEILKAEFKRALEHVAEVVGHESATLRSQYLVPGLEDEYLHDGTVLKSLKVGTKTESEREDEEIEELVKPDPSKKPPRHDLRKERLYTDDPDLDISDDDLSMNYKKVASRYLLASMTHRIAHRWLTAAKADEDAFQAWAEKQGPKFTNPVTKKQVTFKTLEGSKSPAAKAEAKKIRKDWSKDREKGQGDREEESAKKEEQGRAQTKTEQTDKAVKKVTESIPEEDHLTDSDASSRQEMLGSALKGQTLAGVKDLEERLGKARKTNRDQTAKLMAGGDDLAVAMKVPEGTYGKAKLKSQSFNPDESEAIIKRTTSARDEVQSQIDALKKPDPTSTVDPNDPKTKKKIEKLEQDLGAQNQALNVMVAYHVGMVELTGALSKPSGSDDPKKRLSEAAKSYKTLPKDVAAKRKERAEADQKHLTDELDKATEADKPGLQKKLDVANAEVAAARYHEITTGGEKGDDSVSKLVGKFKHLGPNSPHIQALLLEGTGTEAGRKAMFTLCSRMSDKDLVEFAGEHASGLDFSNMGKGAAEFARKAILNRVMMAESDDEITEEELEGLDASVKGMVEKTKGDPKAEKGVRAWLGKTKDVLTKGRKFQRVSDWFKNLDFFKKAPAQPVPPKSEAQSVQDGDHPFRGSPYPKSAGKPKKQASSDDIASVVLVADRFLAYCEGNG
jgi:DNA topoisomerase-1